MFQIIYGLLKVDFLPGNEVEQGGTGRFVSVIVDFPPGIIVFADHRFEGQFIHHSLQQGKILLPGRRGILFQLLHHFRSQEQPGTGQSQFIQILGFQILILFLSDKKIRGKNSGSRSIP